MIVVTESVHARRPPEVVFSLASDPAMLARWQGGTSHVSGEGDGAPAVGSRTSGVRRYAGMPMRWTSEVTEYAPPHRLAFRLVGVPLRVEGLQEFSASDGGTLVRMTLQVDIRGPVRIPLGDRTERMIREQLREDLQRLRDLAESRSGASRSEASRSGASRSGEPRSGEPPRRSTLPDL